MGYKDYHLHLSGSANPLLLYELVKENGYKLKQKDYHEFAEVLTMNKDKIKSLDDYVATLHEIDAAQSFPRAIELCFYDAYKSSYLNGADELQLRWNPVKRSQDGRIDLDLLLVAARAGAERAKNYFGITGSMILCMGRDISEEANAAIYNKALQYHGKGVAGIDVAGSERLSLQKDFKYMYQFAKSRGIVTTIHVGETKHDASEEELRVAIEDYKTQRIGHGVQIVNFPKLMELASNQEIVFELCITSNLTTRAVASLEEYAKIMKTFEEYRLKYVVCTDATYAIDTNIKKENMLMEEIKKISRNL